MEQVQSTRHPVGITKREKPLARLVPVENAPDEFLGRLAGRIKILGDITEPLEPPEAWEALR
jgi:antitoxin (DNA-binding transcriptional repressor) of toxin-antitoxin stability system